MGSELELLDSRYPDKLFVGIVDVDEDEEDEVALDGSSRFKDDDEDVRDGEGSGSVDGSVASPGGE